MLAAGESVAETARTLKITPRTVFRWREDPKFRAALDGLLSDVEVETRDRLRVLMPKGLTLLDKELAGSGHPALRAAREVLNRTLGKPIEKVEASVSVEPKPEIKIYIPDNGRYNPAATTAAKPHKEGPQHETNHK